MQHAEQKAAIYDRLEAELVRASDFENMHGITPANIRQFLVDPYPVMVDPDDAVSAPREMWVILRERSQLQSGYVVVFDTQNNAWGVAEQGPTGDWILTVGADTLARALSSM